VSDLHLTGDARPSPQHDPSLAFARFVEDLTGQLRKTGSRMRIVLLGDMLDLTRLEARVAPIGPVAASIERLGLIADAHSEIFGALGRFVSAGGHVDVVVGNHDLDLAHPAVQDLFIARLGLPSRESVATGVSFHRWFLYLNNVVYAEHGHRYHDINVVPVPGDRDVPGVHAPSEVPLAAYLDSYLRAMRASGSRRTLARDLATLTWSLVARTARHDSSRPARALPMRNAANPGLDGEALVAIDALSAHVGGATAVRIGRTILGPPLRLVLPYGAAAGLFGLVLRGTPFVRPAVALASAAALATLVRSRRRLWPPPRSTGYALEAAEDLRRMLESFGFAVPVFVLGHTHVPALVELHGPGARATYLNTGSWSAPDRGGRGYPFVRVTRIEAGEPDAELLWWPARETG
jgi:UDP-2,3-diacylglucosamine pyrophosphatase LpxH